METEEIAAQRARVHRYYQRARRWLVLAAEEETKLRQMIYRLYNSEEESKECITW